MKSLSAEVKKVKKGLIRSTVLDQVNALEEAISKLSDARDIKKKELPKHEGKKAEVLKKQISILEKSIGHFKQGHEILKDYKNHTTSDL